MTLHKNLQYTENKNDLEPEWLVVYSHLEVF